MLTVNVAWITLQIEHFQQEEKIFAGAQGYSQTRSSGNASHPWGPYDRQPCRKEPVGSVHIRWIYIVDLDKNCLAVRTGSGWSREFKLENPPRHLFEERDDAEELMMVPISLRFLYGDAPAIGHNPADLARFTEFAPRQYSVDVVEESHFNAGAILDSWKHLSQLLLQNFLERYITIIKELATAKNLAILASTGLDGKTTAAYQFKQLAFGILNLCDPVGRIVFRPTCINPSSLPPQWECPDRNVLWMGDVLVILEARIAVEEFLHAAIGKAIDLIRRSHVRIGGIHGIAVIFSIQALVIVNIKYPDNGTSKPDLTFSQVLPVITPSECCWTRCFGGLHAKPTNGIAALMSIFAKQSECYSLPAGLPVEIYTQIYRLSNLATRKSMTESCRAFRAIIYSYPRIGEWDLLHTWNHGNVGFVARRGERLAKSVVSLEECKYPRPGYEVGVFRGRQWIDLDLPSLEVVKQQDEGFKGCACCVGLPVLTEAPRWPSRAFNIPAHIEQERELSNRLARGE